MRTSAILTTALVALAVLAPRPARAAGAQALLARLAAERTPRAALPAFRDARRALERLAAQAVALRVRWDDARVHPSVLRGLTLALPGDTLAARARAFFAAYSALLLAPGDALDLADQRRTHDRTVLRFTRRHRGVPILDGEVRVAFDSLGRLRALHAEAAPGALPSVRPAVSAATALRSAYRGLTADPRAALPARLSTLEPRLVVLAEGAPRLIYVAVFPGSVDPRGRIHLVDARDGSYVGWRPGVLSDPLPREEVRR